MFDLEDGLTVVSYRIPWLIWIQILIFFLLIFLLCCFTLFTSDLSQDHIVSSSSSASPSMADAFLNKGLIFNHNTNSTVANRLHHNQVGEIEIIKGEIETSASRRILREDNTETDGLKTNTTIDFHPCNYFRLAKLAFLKCFGLDSTSHKSFKNER